MSAHLITPLDTLAIESALGQTLHGSVIRLEPITRAHHAALWAIAHQNSEQYRYSNLAQSEAIFEQWFELALREHAFVVVRQQDDSILGSTRLYHFNLLVPYAYVGYTWYAPEVFGTAVNVECKYMLLTHAFEHLHLERVGFEVDSENIRSQRAVLKLGAQLEGVLRQHRRRYSDGQFSDTHTFSILKSEWPQIKDGLQSRLRAF